MPSHWLLIVLPEALFVILYLLLDLVMLFYGH